MSSNLIARCVYRMLVLSAVIAGLTPSASAKDVDVLMLNRGSGGAPFVFAPEVVHIMPGDTVNFVATDTGHEVHSVPGMIPNGAQSFEGKLNQGTKVTFTALGVYVIACKPHTPMGMVGIVVVGDPVNLDKVDPARLPGKARAKLEGLLATLKK